MRIRLAVALVILLCATAALAQTSYTSAANGSWSQPTNWSPNGVPGASDSVTIQAAHTISLDSARSVTALTVNGTLNLGTSALTTNTLTLAGTVSGSGSLTLNSTGSWTGGALSGGSTLTIPAGANLTISGTGSKTIGSGFRVAIGGAVFWTGGTIYLNDGGVLEIQPNALFDAQSNNTILNSYYNGAITNNGTFRKSAGAGVTTIGSGVPFSSSGRIEITSGTLNAQSLTLNSGAAIAGTGFTVSSGTTTIAGPCSVEAGSTMTVSGGTLTGTSTLTIDGTLNWTGGVMSLATVAIPAGRTMTMSGGTKTLASGFRLSVAGTARWSAGTVHLNDGSVLEIVAGGLFVAEGDGTMSNTYYSGSIVNSGTFRKSGTTGATVVSSGVPFTNNGRLEILTGTSNIQELSLNAGSVIAGSGLTLSAGATRILGASTVESGATMTQSGGVLTGIADLTVNGTFEWKGGSMDGGASLTIPATRTLNISTTATKTLGTGFDIFISGIANWTGGTIAVNDGSTLNVLAGGLFDAQSNNAITNTYYNGSLSNAGIFRKSGGIATTSVSTGVPMTNTGRIEALTGTLAIPSLTLNTGSVITGTGFTVNGGTFNVIGTTTLAAGASMTLAAGGNLGGSFPFTVDGTLNWTGGSMDATNGSANISGTGVLNITGVATKTLGTGFDLNIGSIAHWIDGAININDGARLIIQAGGVFQAEGDDSISNTYYNGTITNDGTFRKSAGAGNTSVSSGVPFINNGRIEVNSGTMTPGNMTLNTGSVIAGMGFKIASGTTSVAGSTTVEAGSMMTQSGGRLAGGGVLTVNGSYSWTGGEMDAGGTTLIPAGSQITISGAGAKTLATGRILKIEGTAVWSDAGPIYLNDGSSLHIAAGGVFDATNDATITNTYYNGSITNNGKFRKSGGTGTTAVSSGVPFLNGGRIEVPTGTFTAAKATFNDGTVISGTGYRIASGTTTLAGPSILEAGSAMTLSGGVINGTSSLTINGRLDWLGGAMDGAGSTIIPAGSMLEISGTGAKTLGTGFDLLNSGTMHWMGGNINLNDGSLLNNQAGGVFLVETDADISNTYYNGSFVNDGTLRKRASIGTTAVSSSVPFTNAGTIDIQSGALQVTNPSLAASTILNFGISGTTPLSGHGRLNINGSVTLAGTIDVDVLSPFVPQGGDTFTVITFGSRTGTLAESLAFGSGRSFTTTYYQFDLTLTASGPTIATVSPASGPTAGGTSVTLNGSGFVATPSVTFGGTPATSVVFNNTGQLTAVAPAHAAGTVDIVITNPDGQPTTAVSGFTYVDNGDLSIVKTSYDSRVATGAQYYYEINVNNSGPSTAVDVTVTDTLPNGVGLVSVFGTGWNCSDNGASPPTITCTMASLGAGFANPIGLDVTAPATPSASLTNTATVTSSTADPTPSNNSSSATVEVVAPAASITVTSPEDSGPGTLRQALEDAGNGLCTEPCTIAFNLSPLQPIQPLFDLPYTQIAVNIDGSTQPGYAGTPLVEINGSLCEFCSGLGINGTGGTVRALSINGFTYEGIFLGGGGGHQIRDSYIGLTSAGTASPNSDGISIASASNTITGTVVSGNTYSGIHVGGFGETSLRRGSGQKAALQTVATGRIGGADSNVIESSLIGTSPDGTTPMPNATGVSLDFANNTIIRDNTIAFNTSDGVYVDGGLGHQITGNSIHSNGESEIDLYSDVEPTVNDTGDADTGPNNLQNTPVINSAVLTSGSLRVNLGVDSAATSAASLSVEIFRGGSSLGGQCFDGNSIANAMVTVPAGPTQAGDSVSATATSFATTCGAAVPTIGDGTSEYSTAATVTACTPPSVTVSATATTFCTGNSVTLTANPSGGAAPYTYQWFQNGAPMNGQTGASLVVTAGGRYSVTVTDSIGCSASSAETVIAEATPAPATITAGGPTTFCEGGSVVLTANDGASWLWSTGETTRAITATTSGNYSVTVRDANGCSATSAPVTVTANPTPDPSISHSGPLTFCQGGSVTLSTGAASSYLWSTGATTQSIVVTASGNYSVRASNGSCSATSAPITVTVDPAPDATVTTSGPTTFCQGGSVTLTAAGASSYSWSTGESTQSIVVTTQGSYSVIVTGANGCSATSPVTNVLVKPTPAVAITGPGSTCSGQTVVLDAGTGFASYSWSTGASTRTISVTPATTTAYTVRVTNEGGCAANDSHTVTVTPNPTPSISGPGTVCSGNSITLDAGAGFASYAWSTGATTQTVTVSPTASTTYNVTVTNAAGCSGSTSKNVTVNAAPNVAITGPTSTCSGQSVTLDAGAGFTTYAWSTGATTRTITVTPSGATTYSVTVKNSGGCTASDAHTVEPSTTPSAAIAAPASICANATATASVTPQPNATYTWTVTGGSIVEGQGTPSVTFRAGGTGSVQLGVTVTQGACTSTGNATVPISTLTAPVISGPGSVCPNMSFTLDAGSGFAGYLWSTGATTQSITTTQAAAQTTYSVTVRNASGCTATASKTVVLLASPVSAISAPAAANPGQPGLIASVPSQGDATYTWTILGGTITAGNGTRQITFTAGNESTVTLGVTVTIGSCSSTGSATVSLTSPEAELSVTMNGPASVTTNAPLQYSVTVTNAGPVTAANVALSIAINNATPGPATGNGWSCTTGPATIFCTASTHVIGSSTIAITATAPAAAGSVSVTASLTSSTADPISSNNVASMTTAVRDQASCGANGTATPTEPPAGATVTSPVPFSWIGAASATGYRVWMEVDGGPAQEVGSTDGATTLTGNVPPGSIRWFVEAFFGACPSTRSEALTFTVSRIDPCAVRQTPTLVAPSNNTTVTSSFVEFRWTGVVNVAGYRVWTIVNDGAPQAIGETEATVLTLRRNVGTGTVRWFVEALFPGCLSTESERFTFSNPPAPNCGTQKPALIAPADEFVTSNANIVFSWQGVPNAVGYEVYLALDSGTPVLIGTTSSLTLTEEVPAGRLQWFVRALLDRCPSQDSPKSDFTYEPPADCTQTRPLLSGPSDETEFSPVDFKWSDAGATTYKVFATPNGTPSATPVLLATTSTNHADGIALQPGTYDWFVQAIYANDCPTLDSTASTFTVARPPAACEAATPEISAPSEVSSSVEYEIEWTEVAGATYVLQEARRGDFSDAVTFATPGTSLVFAHSNTTAFPEVLLYRVRAIVSCAGGRIEESPFSDIAVVGNLPVKPPAPAGETRLIDGATPAGDPQDIVYTLSLPASLAGLSFTATPNQPWLTVVPTSGVVPADGLTLTVTAHTRGLAIGTSLGGVTITTAAGRGSRGTTTHQTTNTTTTVSVNLVTPVTSNPKSTPPPDALIIPAVAHADGINSKFQSDVRVTNTSPQVVKYQLTFTPSGESGLANGKQTTVEIEPGRTMALNDVLKSWFGTGTSGSATGTLEVRPLTLMQTQTPVSSSALLGTLPNLSTFASSRTFNVTEGGTFGQYIPAIPFASFVGRSTDPTKPNVLSLQQVAHSAQYRTNFGLVEGSGSPASLVLSVFGASGAKMAEIPIDLKGGQHMQTSLGVLLAQRGMTQLADGRMEVRVTSPGGKVTAYASVLDNQTSDPLLVTPTLMSQAGSNKYVIAGVADLNTGIANWRTDARVFNAGKQGVDATLSFYSQNGGEPRTAKITLSPSEVRQLDSMLNSLFGVTNDGGALHISTPSNANLIATARTYNDTTGGTFGQFISAVTPGEAIGAESRPLQILQVEESDRFRSNIGIAEVTGKPAKVRITAIPPDSKFSAVIEMDLAANQFRQLGSLLKQMGLDSTYNARVTVKVIGGTGRVTAYASVIDMQTQDPTFVPAQ